MAKFKAKYTATDIIELYRLRAEDGDEGRIRRLAKEFRSLCALEHEVTIPKQYEAITRQVRTPFIRDSHLRITSSLLAKPFLSHITPKDEKNADYRDAASIGERWDMALLDRLNKEQGTDLAYDAMAALVRDGESVIKGSHRPRAWANFPSGKTKEQQDEWKRGVDLPFALRVVDRLSIVYEDGEYGDDWVIEYGEYARPYLKARYGMQQTDSGKLIDPHSVLEGSPLPEGLQSSSNGHTVKVEFFDDSEWHVIIDGSEAPGWPKANPYAPHLPYFRASAYGKESLLYSLLYLVPPMDELLTMKMNWSVLGAYPNPYIKTNPNPVLSMAALGDAGDATATAAQGPVKWAPGKLLELGPGQEIGYLAPPPVGKDLNDLIALLKGMIDIAGIPSIMRGISGAGDSGYLGSQMRAAAEMAYKLAAVASARQWAKALEFLHWMVPNVVKQTVYVRGWDSINPKTGKPTSQAKNAWLGLSPDSQGANIADVSKLGPVEVQYRPLSPTDQQANAMIALQMTNAQKPLYDVRHALETFLQEEDPDSILDALAVEKALSEPPLSTMVTEEALREAGLLPKTPPAPAPASGLVGPNGQPLVGGPMSPGMQGVPMANGAPPGMPGVPGLTMPLNPQMPQGGGVPGMPGGRPAGAYPGQPGGPQR